MWNEELHDYEAIDNESKEVVFYSDIGDELGIDPADSDDDMDVERNTEDPE